MTEHGDEYVLRGADRGAERLALLTEVVRPTTRTFLESLGDLNGLRCLDAGCGNGDVSLFLRRAVGDAGAVLGIDFDEGILAHARAEARRQELDVTFERRSIQELEDEACFDLAYARFLLTHLSHPADALRRLARGVKKGGRVAVEDIDFSGHFCHPPCGAFDRYQALYREAVRLRGGDACIGLRLHELFLATGLQEVEVTVRQPVFVAGSGKRMARVTLEHVREAVVASGLATHAEIDDVAAGLAELERSETSLMSMPRLFQVRARV